MQVKEIMTANPACCMPDTNLKEVSKLMVENDCGCIPVVENQNSKKPLGTVTDRDITIRTVAMGKNPLEMKAADIMSSDVVTIKPETDINRCGQVMKENDIRRVLVVDESGCCCGIVAQADIAEYGPNPMLVSNVVHDISESAPTPIESDSEKTESEKSSFFKLSTVLPLAAGVAAGAAYKYFTASDSKSQQKDVEQYRVKHSADKPPMPTENYGKDVTGENCGVIAVATITTEIEETFPNENKSLSDADINSAQNSEFGRSATQK